MGVHTEIRTMARDRMRRPVTDANLEELREAMREQRSDIREELAERGVDVTWSQTVDDADPERDAADSD